MANDIIIVFWIAVGLVLALLMLFQLGVARQRFRQRKFGTIAVMYGDWVLAFIVFKLTVLLAFDGPLLALHGLNGYDFGWIPWLFRAVIVVFLFIMAVVVIFGGMSYAVIWSSSEDFWPKVWSVPLFIFYAWFIGACVVGIQ